MSQWHARLNRVIRRGLDRSLHPWPAINACDGSHSTCRHRIAPYTVGDTGSHAAHGSGELVVEAQHEVDAVTVALAGEFDLASAAPVREVLTRALGEPRQELILDLSKVTFIDSGGLHVILDVNKLCLCRDAGPTLTIRPGPRNVQRVFELTNLLDYLPFEIRG